VGGQESDKGGESEGKLREREREGEEGETGGGRECGMVEGRREERGGAVKPLHEGKFERENS